jgi:hypothetical protein
MCTNKVTTRTHLWLPTVGLGKEMYVVERLRRTGTPSKQNQPCWETQKNSAIVWCAQWKIITA